MKKVLITMIMVAASACTTSMSPALRAPAAPVSVVQQCPPWMCGTNGTQLTGLTQGDRAGAVQTITLPTGEVIPLQ